MQVDYSQTVFVKAEFDISKFAVAMFERSQGFRSLGRILVQNEKFLIIWLFVVLFLHVCQHSFPYVSQPSPTDLPPQATESRCQKACFRRRIESPFVWNHASLISHVKQHIHQQRGDHAHTPKATHAAHTTKSSVASYKVPKDDSLPALQKFINDMLGPYQGVYLVVGAGGNPESVVTRPLEARPGWRGLLVEANPRNFVRLRDAGTNASLLNTCVTHLSYPHARWAWRPHGADVEGAGEEIRWKQEEHFMLKEYVSEQEAPLGSLHKVMCVPLETVVRAYHTKEVHLLVLDTPGLADDILSGLARSNFKYSMVIVRAHLLANGLDDSWYEDLAQEVGLEVLAWMDVTSS
ncbi:uncharacterized protein LOC119572423 [Penaeus monodon]|uniref:uncharacterized protein LOC119572423 n=1 Tax=Penaeus monodon TaxID=6687 RepID=UPI0018A76489|nr:uncharacterized protein LOC119572423 [Penaeus monodon]